MQLGEVDSEEDRRRVQVRSIPMKYRGTTIGWAGVGGTGLQASMLSCGTFFSVLGSLRLGWEFGEGSSLSELHATSTCKDDYSTEE